MKNTKVVVANQKAINYFLSLNPVEAKLTLWSMTMIKGEEKLEDSPVTGCRIISRMYDGVIQAKFAKELAAKLAEAYSANNSGALLTKKTAESYTEVNHRKLREALGLYGFDYVLTVLRYSKANIHKEGCKIDEKSLLKSLRWEERRECEDIAYSNMFHRTKGLELLGFGIMAPVLLEYSFVIANLYEQAIPLEGNVDIFNLFGSKAIESQAKQAPEEKALTVRQMKIHLLQYAELIESFYNVKKPEIPAEFDEKELVEGSMTYKLAQKNLLKDSEKVIQYVLDNRAYADVCKKLEAEFTDDEIEVIVNESDKVRDLIKNAW